MNFNKLLQFINKKKVNNNFKILYLIILALFIFFLSYFYSLEPDVEARDFLPKETSFYYEWVDVNKNIHIDFFDNNIPNNKKNNIFKIIDNKKNKVESIVWFKVDNEDNFLIKFSKKLKKSFLKDIRLNNPNYFFKIKQKYILYITEEEEFLNILPNYLVEDFIFNSQMSSINIYWKETAPDFLKQLVEWINPILNNKKDKDLFLSINNNSINLFYKKENNKKDIDWSSSKIINNFDSLIFIKNIEKDKNILNNLLISIYNNFPHHVLPLKNILHDIVLLQKNNDYLLIGISDWKLIANKLIEEIKLIEVDNILPDGTKYIELKQLDKTNIIEHNYLNTRYWQIDNNFGLNFNKFYYLSNNKDIIKDLIKSNIKISDVIYPCLKENNIKINNLLYLNVDKVKNEVIKEYLENNNLKFINLIHYNNYVTEGLKLCF